MELQDTQEDAEPGLAAPNSSTKMPQEPRSGGRPTCPARATCDAQVYRLSAAGGATRGLGQVPFYVVGPTATFGD